MDVSDLYDVMYHRVENMSDGYLKFVWHKLQIADAEKDYAPGVPMVDWMQAINAELERRLILHNDLILLYLDEVERKKSMTANTKPFDDMYKKVEGYSNQQIQSIWDALKNYDPSRQYAPGITMDEWAQAIYSEMDKRNMPHIKKK